jgi:hypothetical protein
MQPLSIPFWQSAVQVCSTMVATCITWLLVYPSCATSEIFLRYLSHFRKLAAPEWATSIPGRYFWITFES